jgi:hypothetical protein
VADLALGVIRQPLQSMVGNVLLDSTGRSLLI